MYKRSVIVGLMASWVGAKQGGAVHKSIIDTYNGHRPLARGYKAKYTDAWCATTVSAAAIAVGYTAIIPLECSCSKMIALAKQMGIWQESDAYTPAPGDIVLYDWQDTGAGDNTGNPDHVGVVEKVSGGIITVIEGNKNKSVARRDLLVNGKFIRGFILPKYDQETQAQPVANAEKNIWDACMMITGNKYGAAGLMGNLYAESGLKPNNMQNSYEKKLGMSDDQYVAAVDNGSYGNFVRDAVGFGLAQWTYWSRKQNLLDHAKSKGVSIADLNMQLDFLAGELKGYPGVLNVLKGAASIREASDAVLTGYERPADQSEAVKARRASFGQQFYDKYAGGQQVPQGSGQGQQALKEIKTKKAAQKMDRSLTGTYTATSDLHCRDGAGTGNKSLVIMPKGTKVQCFGYYSPDGANKWLYITFTYKGVKYTGFSSAAYLKK